MSFSVGIVGLPNVGKSTLFKTLTKIKVDIAAYPFTTIHPNVGVVQVPDQRLEKIAEVIRPEKITPTIIEFVDIAGLVKGAHKGEGLGNQFLAQIRNCDAVLEVARAFEDPNVENVLGEINPEREIEIVNTELLMKDLETLEGLLLKIEKDTKKDKKALNRAHKKDLCATVKKIKETVSQGKLIAEIDLTDEEKVETKEYQFLTQKPMIFLLNTNASKCLMSGLKHLEINLKDEDEISELSEIEARELEFKSQIAQLIIACYNILNLITFYTVAGGKETRAWTIVKNSKAPQAGGIVHSDFEEKFIRAEVINWQKLVEAQSWPKARELGWIRTVGKEYVVEDGDVIEFRI